MIRSRAPFLLLVMAIACGGSDDPGDTPGADAGGGVADSGAGAPDSAVDEALPAPIGYWPFNDVADDASGENINLVLVGDATFAPSLDIGLGSALSLDGDADGAIGADFVKASGDDLTVVAWVRADGLEGDWDTIVKSWGETVPGQFHLGLGGGVANTLQNTIIGGSATASADFLTGQWVHTAFVLDSAESEHRLYVNGIVVANEEYTGPVPQGTATGLGVGGKPYDDGSSVTSDATHVGYWQGLIDEVGIFDQALTTDQIKLIRQRALEGMPLADLAAAGD
jgi:hypothetical protein